jgi:hypothetical protein
MPKQRLGPKTNAQAPRDAESRAVPCLKKFALWVAWLGVIIALCLPSLLYAASETLPADNTTPFAEYLKEFHHAAPVLIVGLDFFVVRKACIMYSKASGIKADRLLMSLRLCSAWLVTMVITVFLHENCYGGWKTYWKVCDPHYIHEHSRFDWEVPFSSGLGGKTRTVLSTKEICDPSPTWWNEGRCSRAVVEVIAPLFLKKVVIRACIQPLLILASWYFSVLEVEGDLPPLQQSDGEHEDGVSDPGLSSSNAAEERGASSHDGRNLKCFGQTTSGSLMPMQQHAFLVTLMEMAMWGVLMPLLALFACVAIATNLFVFQVGIQCGVVLPSDRPNREAGLSSSYLRFTLIVLTAYQLWFAFETQMHGRWLLASNAMLLIVSMVSPCRKSLDRMIKFSVPAFISGSPTELAGDVELTGM